ncbi:drs2 neo1 protein, partial [Coemansia pectinata]
QVEAVCEEIERDLMLSGISAIEDRLQAGVPETIFKLRRAGIRVWMLTGDKVETAINIGKSCRLIDTEVVEQTKLDMALASGQSGKMTLLVMQSMTDYDALNRLITEALDVARSLVLSVDERFERLTKRQRLARGFKRFGNMFDPRRLRYRKDHECGTVAGSDCPEPAGQQAKSEGYPDDKGRGDHPSLTSSSIAAATSAVGNVYHGAPPTEIEWADTVGCATPTTLGVGARPDTTGASPIHPTCPVIERASSAATTSVSHEKLPANSPAQPPPLEGSSSSSSSMRTRGVDEKPSGPGEALPPAVGNGGASLAVVIDGETLATLEEHADKGVLDRFLTLGTLCDAVICSRVSPSQKALIVHNMRVRCEGGDTNSSARKSWWCRCLNPVRDLFTHDNDKYMVTLAIGDGGNDIAMIQEAHVGIGIAGQEGLQASRAADFSIGQFRFLQKLLLVHGRWSYVRVSMFIMGTFYKCMAFYATQLIFQFYTGFSGTSLFESWTLSMYNTLFSILPVLVVGIFEQDLQPETLLAYPELYRDMGPRNHLFTVPLFLWRVVFIGIVHAVTAAFFPFAANLALGAHSSSNDLYITGFVVYSIMVLIVTFKIAYIDVRRWVIFSHLSVILTLAVWFGWNGVLNHVYPQSPGSGYNVLGVFHLLMKEGAFWFEWIIFVAIALCLNVLIKTVYSVRDPVEHRIMTWVACERRQESAKHKMERRQWLSNLGARNPIRSIGLMVGRNTGGRPRSHSE